MSAAHLLLVGLLSWKEYLHNPVYARPCDLSAFPSNATLTEIGLCTGTDKAWDNMYTMFYSSILDRFRPLEFNMLEIGVAEVASLKMWDKYFPKAHTFGADIGHYPEPRIIHANQANEASMRALGAYRPWTIVLDDGSHKPIHVLNTFMALFPTLPPGGIYIIEDMETNYWGQGHGRAVLYGWNMKDENEQSNAIGRFLEIVHVGLNADFMCHHNQNQPIFSWDIDLNIGSVQFIRNAVVITKSPEDYYPGLMRPTYRHHMKRDCSEERHAAPSRYATWGINWRDHAPQNSTDHGPAGERPPRIGKTTNGVTEGHPTVFQNCKPNGCNPYLKRK